MDGLLLSLTLCQAPPTVSDTNPINWIKFGRDLVYFTMAASASNVAASVEDIVSDLLSTPFSRLAFNKKLELK